ncbi:MAG: cyclic nucleotide-binding domain-containing protein [Deltaproteobacteria bacterium]|nr:MAG: cyclic nucleotide-binding domain-containing protein [Deltaproteobacteria bacterium]
MSQSEKSVRYEKLREVAQGSASSIYKSYDHALLRDVAMKVLDPRAKEFPEELERFREEAQVTAQLEHPNIVPVYDWYVDDEENLCFLMQYVRGGTLRDHLQEKYYDPSVEADLYRFLQIYLKVCEALSFAHSKGVIHRDLKPDNIMVGSHGQVYLLDWGILRLIAPEKLSLPVSTLTEPIQVMRDPEQSDLDLPGMVLGTLAYLSPEQARGELEEINERTDVFALGAILYEILTQQPPYFAWTPEEFVEQAKACAITPPQEKLPDIHLPAELCRIAMKAMEAEQKDRYASVDELRNDLEKFLQGGGRFTKRNYKPNETIVTEGEDANCAYMIVRGHCDVFKTVDGQRLHVGRMSPGEVFGETAVFVSGKRTASVVAADEVSLKIIERDALEQEVGFDSWISSLISHLAERFIKVDKAASDRQKLLKDAQLLNRTLLFALQQGAPSQSGSASIPKSALLEHLAKALDMAGEELEAQLQQLPGISSTESSYQIEFAKVHIGTESS